MSFDRIKEIRICSLKEGYDCDNEIKKLQQEKDLRLEASYVNESYNKDVGITTPAKNSTTDTNKIVQLNFFHGRK